MPDLYLLPDTSEKADRARAPLSLGMKLGASSLLLSFGPAAWFLLMWLIVRRAESTSIEGSAALTVLGSFVLSWAGVAAAIVLGIIALRRNRFFGKLMAVVGLIVSIATVVWAITYAVAGAEYV